jgi:hypothetical protein
MALSYAIWFKGVAEAERIPTKLGKKTWRHSMIKMVAMAFFIEKS